MPLAFLLDEHFRGPLWMAILGHNIQSANPLDVCRVGDIPDLRFGVKDDEILLWAERESRILITRDRRTMPRFLKLHLASGHHSPGVLIVHKGARADEVVKMLEVFDYCGRPDEFADTIGYIP